MSFPYPTAAEFNAMTVEQFEMFWKTWAAMFPEGDHENAVYLYRNDVRNAVTLKRAGWTCEFDAAAHNLMAWSWRRPRIGKRAQGKLFASPDQALGELIRVSVNNQRVRRFVVRQELKGQFFLSEIHARSFLEAQRITDGMPTATVLDEPPKPAIDFPAVTELTLPLP